MVQTTKIVVTVVLGGLVGGGASVQAQTPSTPAAPRARVATTPLGRSPIRLKLGGFLPGISGTRKAIKDLFLGGGLTYDLAKSAPDSAILSGYLDVTGDENNDAPFAASLFMVGVGPQLRYVLNGPSAALKSYVGVGAGLYVIHAIREGLRSNRLYTRDDTFMKFGTKLFTGLELRSGVFGELSYTAVGSTNDLNGSGLNIAFGLRL